jgi:hypothetical protein
MNIQDTASEILQADQINSNRGVPQYPTSIAGVVEVITECGVMGAEML